MYNEIIIKNKVDTVTKAFNYAVKKYGNRDCLGTRQVLGKLLHRYNYQSWLSGFKFVFILRIETNKSFLQERKMKYKKMEKYSPSWPWENMNG